MITALIDADSIVYIVAWNFKDDEPFAQDTVKRACDDFVRTILTMVKADEYIGVFSSKENFRHKNYKYQPYKGNRPAKPEFIVKWEVTIKGHLTEKWGFYTSPSLEADDIVVALAATHPIDHLAVVCSPDKDLRQVAGPFYDYRLSANQFETITEQQACINLWKQVLTGDATDNISGVPGLGEVKVKKLFDEVASTEDLNDINLMQVVRAQFVKYFGPYYGPEIYMQTLQAVMMVRPGHSLWEEHKPEIDRVRSEFLRETPPAEIGDSDEVVLENLGWDF